MHKCAFVQKKEILQERERKRACFVDVFKLFRYILFCFADAAVAHVAAVVVANVLFTISRR